MRLKWTPSRNRYLILIGLLLLLSILALNIKISNDTNNIKTIEKDEKVILINDDLTQGIFNNIKLMFANQYPS